MGFAHEAWNIVQSQRQQVATGPRFCSLPPKKKHLPPHSVKQTSPSPPWRSWRFGENVKLVYYFKSVVDEFSMRGSW